MSGECDNSVEFDALNDADDHRSIRAPDSGRKLIRRDSGAEDIISEHSLCAL